MQQNTNSNGFDVSAFCNMLVENLPKRGRYECIHCGKSYVRSDSLARHTKYECGKEPSFHCPLCPHRSCHKHDLLGHIRRRHDTTLNTSINKTIQ